MIRRVLLSGLVPLAASLAGCAPERPPVAPAAVSGRAVTASFPCDGVSTPVQQAVCSSPSLAALDVRMAAAFRRHMGEDDLMQRDQVLASQRDWLLGLGAACPATGAGGAVACLLQSYQARIDALTGWQTLDVPWSLAPLAEYVTYKPIDEKEPALCQALLAQAPNALSHDGSLDPARLDGVREVAGTHGAPAGAGADGTAVSVATVRAGLYAGYQRRAQSVSLSGQAAPILGPDSIGTYAATQTNAAGRFGSFASQTGDYGAIDVVVRDHRTLALVTDTIGYYSPANAGEAALAAVFDIGQGRATPVCLFQTYLKPSYDGSFREQPSLGALLMLLDQIHGEPPEALAGTDRQDTVQLADETRWRLFNMPLPETAEVRAAGWTGWLRHRHDLVLDALFAWSQKSPQNKKSFDRLFPLLRPAAQELAQIYRQQQGLSASDAEQATSLALLELLYQSTTFLAPGLAAGPADPAAYRHEKPRYPILASPQG